MNRWFVLFISIAFIVQCQAQVIIGNYDKIDLPLLQLNDVPSKIDTGAKSSVLHCVEVQISKDKRVVTFKPLSTMQESISLPIEKLVWVKSSNGLKEQRAVIKTVIKIFKQEYEALFSLTNRSSMTYPILLGRDFLKQGFLVDVTQENLSFNQKEK